MNKDFDFKGWVVEKGDVAAPINGVKEGAASQKQKNGKEESVRKPF